MRKSRKMIVISLLEKIRWEKSDDEELEAWKKEKKIRRRTMMNFCEYGNRKEEDGKKTITSIYDDGNREERTWRRRLKINTWEKRIKKRRRKISEK